MSPQSAPRSVLAILLAVLLAGCQSQAATAVPAPTTTAAPATAAPTSPPSTETLPTPAPTPDPRPTTLAPALSRPPAPAPDAFSGERALRDVEALAVQIGSRIAGSQANVRAADYLQAQYEAAGLTVERQPFTFTAYDDRGSQLDLPGRAGPGPGTQTLTYSAGGDVQAELVYVDLARPGDFDPAAVRGRLALAKRGENRFAEKVSNLSAAGAVGVVIFNNVPGGFAGNLLSRSDVPAVSISQADGEQLMRALEQGPINAHLRVDAEVLERTAQNVIATRSGGPRTVIVGGHYDSVQAGPGANDNGSGTATTLELARVVAGREYPFTVRFIAFDAEEIGLVGSSRYAHQIDPAERDQLIGMINLDMVGVGDRLSVSGDAGLVDRAFHQASLLGINVSPLRGASGSDHASFQAVGIPSVFFYRAEDPNYHTAGDRAEYVRAENLAIAGQIVLGILDDLAADAR